MKPLAIFGGEPKFEGLLHVGQPNLAENACLLEAFESILDSKWLTNGGWWVHRLEDLLCAHLNVKHCVAVANGTLGLELAARALMPECGEVIMPSFTFAATPHALAWQGYRPVFADINPLTHVLDPIDVRAKITDNTVGILGVHTWGTPCEIEALTAIAVRHKLPLFFDAAHAFGCDFRSRSIGNFGRCEVFSFHATKFFNTAEGGAITTNDSQLAGKLRELRNFGFTGDGTHETTGVGINAKMSELHAAIGVKNLEMSENFINRNLINYVGYEQFLKHQNLRVYRQISGNYQYAVVELLEGILSADNLVRILRAENVLARRYFSPPCHKMRPYNQEAHDLPVTDMVSDWVVVLPTGMGVAPFEVYSVCQLIMYCMENASQISERLGGSNNGIST